MASRVFGPKSADHPSVGEDCPACKKPFQAGDFTGLVSLGPGDNHESQVRAMNGRPYNAVALEVHAMCMDLRDMDLTDAPDEFIYLAREAFGQ